MTLQLKKIEVKDRATVTTMVIKSWDVICPDITLIDTSLIRGEEIVCDMVGIDKEKKLVLGFIETAQEKDTLTSLINSFDWAKENLKILGKMYSQFSVNINALPAIIVIAPDFSSEFIRALTYLEIPEIGLYRFSCLEVDGKKGIMLEKVNLPVKTARLQDKEEIKESFQVCLECLGLTKEEEEDLLSSQDGIVLS